MPLSHPPVQCLDVGRAYCKALSMLGFVGNVDQEWEDTGMLGHNSDDGIHAEVHPLHDHALFLSFTPGHQLFHPLHYRLALGLVALQSAGALLTYVSRIQTGNPSGAISWKLWRLEQPFCP